MQIDRDLMVQKGINIQNLINKSQNGDPEAFKEIYNYLNDRLFSYALSHTKNRDDALDVLQETFIEIWNSLKRFTYRTDEEFYGFIFTIIKRRLARHYKRKSKEMEDLSFLEPMVEEPKYEDFRTLTRFIDKLPLRYQEILRLRYWSALPFKDIAMMLSVNESTAKVWHHRAIKELQVHMSTLENEF